MQDRYAEIISRIIEIARNDDGVKAVVAIGSTTRENTKADEYSDLDLIIAAEDTYGWLYGSIPEQIADVKISFVEPTLGGGTERRVLFEGALDVDMILFTPAQFETAIKNGTAGWVCSRGYSVLYDDMNFGGMLSQYVSREITHTDMSEQEYINMVNDFCFHVVWASKKLLRGELWSAKMCIDGYLKNYLLKMIELYSADNSGVDVWHDGRFLDSWADGSIKASLKKCFAHYERDDMVTALRETMDLFVRLAGAEASVRKYRFPKTAVDYAENLFVVYWGE